MKNPTTLILKITSTILLLAFVFIFQSCKQNEKKMQTEKEVQVETIVKIEKPDYFSLRPEVEKAYG